MEINDKGVIDFSLKEDYYTNITMLTETYNNIIKALKLARFYMHIKSIQQTDLIDYLVYTHPINLSPAEKCRKEADELKLQMKEKIKEAEYIEQKIKDLQFIKDTLKELEYGNN